MSPGKDVPASGPQTRQNAEPVSLIDIDTDGTQTILAVYRFGEQLRTIIDRTVIDEDDLQIIAREHAPAASYQIGNIFGFVVAGNNEGGGRHVRILRPTPDDDNAIDGALGLPTQNSLPGPAQNPVGKTGCLARRLRARLEAQRARFLGWQIRENQCRQCMGFTVASACDMRQQHQHSFNINLPRMEAALQKIKKGHTVRRWIRH